MDSLPTPSASSLSMSPSSSSLSGLSGELGDNAGGVMASVEGEARGALPRESSNVGDRVRGGSLADS